MQLPNNLLTCPICGTDFVPSSKVPERNATTLSFKHRLLYAVLFPYLTIVLAIPSFLYAGDLFRYFNYGGMKNFSLRSILPVLQLVSMFSLLPAGVTWLFILIPRPSRLELYLLSLFSWVLLEWLIYLFAYASAMRW
jgi:hypothetical protein